MQLEEKIELVRLLNLYQQEKIQESLQNKMNVMAEIEKGNSKWNADIVTGTKAQYNHARMIATKLQKQIADEIPSYYNL